MTRDAQAPPEFVREAYDAPADPSTSEPLLLLEGAVVPEPSLLVRLNAAVKQLPYRYAPFFARLAVLWDLPEDAVAAELARAADPKRWERPRLPGLRRFPIAPGPARTGGSALLMRFRPGLVFPAHRHEGPESLLVLEGRYEDDHGRVVGPGDLHEMPTGSTHRLQVHPHEPCVAAVMSHGFEFTGPIMRVLAKLFG